MLPQKLSQIQDKLFSKDSKLEEGAVVFDILGNACRLEMILALMEIDELSSGEIGQVTNCTPSAVSQALALMKRVGMVKSRREWLNIYYSLDQKNPIFQKLLPIIHTFIKN